MYIDKSNNYLEEQTKIRSYKQRQRKQKRTITNKLNNNNENIEIHFYTTN